MSILNTNITGFDSPVLTQNTEKMYTEVYGADGVGFVRILESAPDENSIISKLLLHLHKLCTKEN